MTDAANYKQGEFCWYEIATRDVGAAKAFYTELLGVTTKAMPMPGMGDDVYTMVQVEGKEVAGLFDMGQYMPAEVPPHWMSYVWVDDVDATVAKAKELGGNVMSEPMDIPGVGRSAAIADPTGAVISVYHGAENPGAARVGFAQGGVGWNELVTPDTAAAKDFYTGLFGWTPKEQDMGEMVYTTYNMGDQGLAGMMKMGPEWEGTPPHWMVYISVDDADAIASHAKSLGAEVVVPPQDVPKVGRFAMIKDPTGAYFGVMKWDMQQ